MGDENVPKRGGIKSNSMSRILNQHVFFFVADSYFKPNVCLYFCSIRDKSADLFFFISRCRNKIGRRDGGKARWQICLIFYRMSLRIRWRSRTDQIAIARTFPSIVIFFSLCKGLSKDYLFPLLVGVLHARARIKGCKSKTFPHLIRSFVLYSNVTSSFDIRDMEPILYGKFCL